MGERDGTPKGKGWGERNLWVLWMVAMSGSVWLGAGWQVQICGMDGGRAAAAAYDPCPSRRPGHGQPKLADPTPKDKTNNGPRRRQSVAKVQSGPPSARDRLETPPIDPLGPRPNIAAGGSQGKGNFKDRRTPPPSMAPAARPFCSRRGALRVSPAGRPPTSIAPGHPSIDRDGGDEARDSVSGKGVAPRTTRREWGRG